MTPVISFGYATHVGQIRDNNEDSMLTFYSDVLNENERPLFGVFVVADGMGGHQNGEKASALATETITENVIRRIYLRIFTSSEESYQPPVLETLEDAVHTANEQIVKKFPRAGTTITGAVIMGNMIYVVHVGDSRAYIIKDGEIEQVSEDHTMVNRLVQMGTMTREEAEQSDAGNRIYRALGLAEKVEIDTITRRFRHGTTLLLCSDGLYGMVDDDAILEIVNSTDDPQRACNMLVELANQNGGHDNVTVIIAKMVNDE